MMKSRHTVKLQNIIVVEYHMIRSWGLAQCDQETVELSVMML